MKPHPLPEKQIIALMTDEIERETTRLSFRFTDLRDRIRIHATEPGVVAYGRIGGGMGEREASFVGVMRVLATLPDRDGSERALDALEKAYDEGRLKPRPQDVGTHLQVGDRIGDAVVETLTLGTTHDDAKNGCDVRSIPRETVVASPERIIVGLRSEGADHGFWRRASQMPGNGLRPTRGSRNALPHLRRLHSGLKRIAFEAKLNLDRPGNADRFLAYDRMATCVGTMLVKAAGPYSSPHAAERIHLDARRRDCLPLLRRGLPDTLAGARVHHDIREELAAIEARKVELGREMAEARPRTTRSPAP